MAAGIALSFLAGMTIYQGIWLYRSQAIYYRWLLDIFSAIVLLFLSTRYITARKAKPGPRSFIEWINDRAKPPLIFDKKD